MNSQAACCLCSPGGWGFCTELANSKTRVENNNKKIPTNCSGHSDTCSASGLGDPQYFKFMNFTLAVRERGTAFLQKENASMGWQLVTRSHGKSVTERNVPSMHCWCPLSLGQNWWPSLGQNSHAAMNRHISVSCINLFFSFLNTTSYFY